jgi:hypothetical protein
MALGRGNDAIHEVRKIHKASFPEALYHKAGKSYAEKLKIQITVARNQGL